MITVTATKKARGEPLQNVPAAITTFDGPTLADGRFRLVLDHFDLASVEVLRGPQGVLLGRNTTGGAALVNTGDPTFAWEGHARVSGQGPVDDGRESARGTVQPSSLGRSSPTTSPSGSPPFTTATAAISATA